MTQQQRQRCFGFRMRSDDRRKRRPRGTPIRPRRLRMEALEDRRLLAPGDLDLTFDGDGRVTTAIGTGHDFDAFGVAIDGNARIVVAGTSRNGTDDDFALVRYNADGSLDTTFDLDGKLTTGFGTRQDYARSVALDASGRIVVAGHSDGDFALARYLADGTLDSSFGVGGKLTTPIGTSSDLAFSLAIDGSGKIVVAGYSLTGSSSDFALARYHVDGSLDTSFDGDGKLTTSFGTRHDYAYSVAIDGNGKIVVAGETSDGSNYDLALARYSADGTLDTSFGVNGLVTTAIGTGDDRLGRVAIDSDGKLVVAGISHNGSDVDFALARYNADGALDTSFSDDGKLTTAIGEGRDYAYGVAIDGNGKIVVAGYTDKGGNYDFAAARYGSNGGLDVSFDSDGKLTTAFGAAADVGCSVAVQSDGKIVVAGYSHNGADYDFAVARYEGNSGPTDISLAPASVAENQPIGTAVGSLTTTDPDLPGDSHTYTLASGTGSADNGSFTIAGSQLQTNAMFDFETKSSYSIRIRTTDRGGLWFEEAFAVTVTDVDEIPTLFVEIAHPSLSETAGVGVSTITVTRNGFTDSALVVTLASSDTTEIWLPTTSLTIPAGSVSATTILDVVNDGDLDGTQTATITASAVDWVTGSDAIEIVDDDVADHRTIGCQLLGTLNTGEYWVTGDLIVPLNQSLTLSPASTLRFHSGKGVYVYGQLRAQAAPGSGIVFTSAQASPAAGDWNGIDLRNGGQPRTTLDYIEVSYATTGVEVHWSVSHPLVTLSHADIHDSSTGVEVSTRWGVYISASDVRIVDNFIHHNQGAGVYLSSYSANCDGSGNTALVADNEISYNAGAGLNVYANTGGWCIGGGGSYVDSTVSGNYIHHNAEGVSGHSARYQAQQSATVVAIYLVNNLIADHSTRGVRWRVSSSYASMTAKTINNTIVGNGGAGVVHDAETDSGFAVRNNIVTGNARGIESATAYTPAGGSVGYNDVFANGALNWVNYPASYGALTTTNANGTPADAAMNISADPQFAAADDFHLSFASPAIDAGTTSNAPGTDFEGEPRTGPNDAGWDEVVKPTVTLLATTDQTPGLAGTVAQPGAIITVLVGGQTYTATNHGDGTWSLADDAISPPLVPGTYDVQVRATDTAGDSIRDETTDELIIGEIYYVNDGSTVHDAWATAVGDDTNDGLSPATPKATVQAVLAAYDLGPGDVVRIDTGTYLLATNLTVDGADGGSSRDAVRFEASPYGVTIDRGDSSSSSYLAWDVDASYVEVTTATSDAHPGVAQRWMSVTGAHQGFAITGDYVAVRRVDANGNRYSGVRLIYADYVTIENCVLRDALYYELDIIHSNYATIRNNTFVGGSLSEIRLDNSGGAVLENNIVSYQTRPAIELYLSSFASSEFNNFYTSGGGKVTSTYATLTEWRQATGFDLHSFSRDPLFVDAAGGDFHLQSTAGSYHGGAWTADAATSPGVDTGRGAAAAEPSPNATALHAADLGQRNLGAYGGTEQASKTPAGRQVWLYEPLGGEIYLTSPQHIRWTWVGEGWQSGDTLNLQVSANSGATYGPIEGAGGVPVNTGDFSWDISGYPSRPLYRVQATPNPTPSAGDASLRDFQIRVHGPITYYVNDSSTTHDIWATVPGNDANDGLSPATPKASVQAILGACDLEPGDVVRIDTGTYTLTSGIGVGSQHAGNSAAVVTFEASPYGVTMDGSATADDVWHISAAYVTLTTAASTAHPGAAQRWMSLVGGSDGVEVLGDYVAVRRVETRVNTGVGIRVSGDANDHVIVENCLVREYSTGIYALNADTVTIRNNTLYGSGSYGIRLEGSTSSSLENNIVWADGAGHYAVHLASSSLATSDYNNFHATGGASVGYASGDLKTLADWRLATGKDSHSFSRDPLFVDAAAADFHLQSTAGSYHGGAWTADGVTSSGVDTGLGTLLAEPSPNATLLHATDLGQRNMGVYGGTEQASKTPVGRHVWLYEPQGNEVYKTSPQNVRWTWSGAGWQSGETIQLDVSSNSGSTFSAIAGAAALPIESGSFIWDISGYASSPLCRVRTTPVLDAAGRDTSPQNFQIRINGPITYYVNDASTQYDIWATAPGDDANDGASPATPKASAQSVLGTYDLGPGDVVRIDTGTYSRKTEISVTSADGGDSTADVTFEQSPYGVTVNRGDTNLGQYGWWITGPYVTLTTVTSDAHPGVGQRWARVTGGYTGVHIAANRVTVRRIDASGNSENGMTVISASDVTIANSLMTGNSIGVSVLVLAAGTLSNNTLSGNSKYGVFQDGGNLVLRNNIVWANGTGKYAVYARSGTLAASDYNDLYATGGAAVGYWSAARTTLADWQAASGKDANSISANPRFANAAGGDFHLQSNGGRYDPVTAVWVIDPVNSPAIDAGDPASPFPNEPAPNGGRINQGAYGNTEQASKSDENPPAVVGVTVSDTLLNDADAGAGKTFTVTVDFTEAMNTAVPPTLAFTPSHQDTLGNPTAGWTDGDTFTVTYEVSDRNVEVANIQIDVSEAVDAAGNGQQDYVPQSEFTIDTLSPLVTVNALKTQDATPAITGTVSQGTLQVVVHGKTFTAGDGNLSVGGTDWTLQIPAGDALPWGTYNVAAAATDAAGNVGSDSTTDELRIVKLIVTGLTPTASGFVAQFSGAFQLEGLNLYDGADGALGPADVILQDGGNLAVAGSLIVDGSRQALTFVATGGVLAPDTYTVTVKSGATALRALDGEPLDGNDDGTTGDDYTGHFTVAASAGRIVSIPDLARGAGQSGNIPDAAGGLPIRLDSADGVTSLAVDLRYDPSLLSITGATLASGIPAGWIVGLDTSTPGVARVAASGTTPLAGANWEVVRLTAAVPNDAPYGAVQAIRLEDISLNGGAVAAIGDMAAHKAAYLGDADGSGIHSSADAFLTVQAALGLASGFAAHAWTDPRIVGDADGSGVLSAADAFLIVQEGLGLAEPFVPDNPDITVTPAGGGIDPQFQIDVDLPASVGGLVTVPVKLDIEPAATNVGAFDFDLFFDPSRLAIQVPEGVSVGADTAGWAVSAVLVAAGQLRVGMVSSTGQPLASGLREIARLQFHVEAGESRSTGWQPVPRCCHRLPITDDRLLMTDYRSPVTDLSDGSEPHPTLLDIEPADPRAGGYTWTEVDGSVAIGAASVRRDVADPRAVRRDNGARPLDELIRDLPDEGLSLADALSEMAADVAVARC